MNRPNAKTYGTGPRIRTQWDVIPDTLKDKCCESISQAKPRRSNDSRSKYICCWRGTVRWKSQKIAVGLAVADQPPQRSRRAELPHRALRKDSHGHKARATENRNWNIQFLRYSRACQLVGFQHLLEAFHCVAFPLTRL
jgi:hypothetical protein